jgi:prepilin-type N-terminal cleavage/methylation domain-containing protein
MFAPSRLTARRTPRPLRCRARGFTLLEMLVALSAFVLLMGGIFAIANSTMELGNDLAVAQDRSRIRLNFIEFLRRSFRSLPGEAELRLAVQARGGTYLPNLNIVNGGSSFTPGAALPPDTSVDLFAEERPGGYLRVGIRLLDSNQTQALRNGQPVRYARNQEVLPLLDNVSRFEWRIYDGASNRWENTWKEARRPLFAEMTLRLDDGFETRAVFWIPPVVRQATLQPAVPGAPLVPGDPNAPPPPTPP